MIPGRFRMHLVLTGVLLGMVQTGLFLQLMFTLSSGYGTYLLVTLAWLVGSAIGARAHLYMPPLTVLLATGGAAYAGCVLLVVLYPFETTLWPIYAVLVMLIGLYPGMFFVRMGQHISAGKLFLWENNGFIAGLVIATVLFMALGRPILWVLPAGAAALCALMILQLPNPAVGELEKKAT